MNGQLSRLSPLVFELRVDYESTNDGFRFLNISDIHFDSPKCRRKLFFEHLEEARQTGAKVFCYGDFFDVMGGHSDPRRSKDLLRPEYTKASYLDSVIDDAVEQLLPYADCFLLFGDGNHETAILKNQETDVLERLVKGLNAKAGTNIMHAGYHGFIRFRFAKGSGEVRTCVLYFHHGKYGGTVTKGTLSVMRRAAVVPDADVIVTGHTHDRWHMEQPQFRLQRNGQVRIVPQHHIRMGTYKEEFEQSGGWAVEKIVAPKSLGGWWMELTPKKRKGVIIRMAMT